MTIEEKFEQLMKPAKSPGGLQREVKNIITSLFADPDVTYKTCKDINEMADKVLFFYQDQVLFQLIMPWNIAIDTTRNGLTEQYKFLLEQK